MAKSRKSSNGSWKGFYSYHLSDEEKIGIRDVVERYKTSHMSERVSELVDNRYKVSVSYNDQSQAYIASVTGQDGSLNKGYTYSITHVDVEMAVAAVWFVCSEVNDWGEWDVDGTGGLDW